MPSSALIHTYLQYLQTERQLRPTSCRSYRRDLSLLLQQADQAGCTLKQLDGLQLRHFIQALQMEAQYSPRTIARMVTAWRGFFAWLYQTQPQHNPARQLKTPRIPLQLPNVLSVDQMQTVFQTLQAQPQANTPLAIRDLAILELLYSSGVRISELVQLNAPGFHQGIQLEQAMLRVLGKRQKTRMVPIGTQAITAVQKWLTVRPQLTPETEPALFTNRCGKRLSVRAIQLRLQKLSHLVDNKLHPHLLRHCCASHLLESSNNLRAVQTLLGHESIKATQTYTHLNFQTLSLSYDQAHPRAARRKPKA